MIREVGVKHMMEGHLSEGDGLRVREGVGEGLSAKSPLRSDLKAAR